MGRPYRFLINTWGVYGVDETKTKDVNMIKNASKDARWAPC